jgi:hypothetical protein
MPYYHVFIKAMDIIRNYLSHELTAIQEEVTGIPGQKNPGGKILPDNQVADASDHKKFCRVISGKSLTE